MTRRSGWILRDARGGPGRGTGGDRGGVPPQGAGAASRCPGTGDAAAFIAGEAGLRRAGRCRSPRRLRPRCRRALAMPQPLDQSQAPARGPRLSDLPIALWAGLGGLFCLAAVMAVVQFNRPRRAAARRRSSRPFAPAAAAGQAASAACDGRRPQAARPPTTCCPPATMPCCGGTIAHATPTCRPGTLPRSVRCRRCVWSRSTGWSRSGWPTAAAASSTPRDWRRAIASAARRAYCAYNAGPSPQNGEVLGRHGDGTAHIEISNRGRAAGGGQAA